MAMAHGYSREDVKNILSNVTETPLIDEKTRKLLLLAEKTTKHSYKISEVDIEQLRAANCSDEEIFETLAVAALFNFMDRMADALGAPVEGLQDMMEKMLQA